MNRRLRSVVLGVLAGLGTSLAIAIPTDVIDTPLFQREIPVRGWEPLVIVAMGALVAIAVTATARSERKEGGTVGTISAVVAALAVGCPVCNVVVVATLGTVGATAIWAPVQPWLAAAAVLVMGAVAARRVRAAQCGDGACRVTADGKG